MESLGDPAIGKHSAKSDKTHIIHGSLLPCTYWIPKTATRMGLEPTASAVTGRRSNQLSHRAKTL